MDVNELYQIVSQWYNTGSLSIDDQPKVLAAHAEITGIVFSECRSCQWADVQHRLRYYLLKELKLPPMDKTQKYMIRKEQSFLQIHGLPYVYVNKGTAAESESAKHLTDAVAEKLLKQYPDLDEVIVKNPDYVEEKAKVAGSGGSKPDDGSTAAKPLTPQQKAAQTKAAQKASQAASEAEAAKAKEAEGANQNPDSQDSQPQS